MAQHKAGSVQAKAFVADYLSYLLGRANYAIYKEFDAEVRARGLRSLEWRVLATLFDGRPRNIGELAAAVLAKQPTVTRLVQRLAREGMVQAVDDGADLRRTVVRATAAGKARVRPLVRRAMAHEAAVLAAFDTTDIAALKRILGAIIRRWDARERGESASPTPASGRAKN